MWVRLNAENNKTDVGTPKNPRPSEIHKSRHDNSLRQPITNLPTFENFNKIPVRCIFPSHFLFFSRSLYAASFLAIFIFLLHSRSVSLYTGFFLIICIFTLLRCCSYSLNSGSDLARLFDSALYCCLIPLHFHFTYHWMTPIHCDNLYIFSWPCQLNLSVIVNIHQQLPVPLKARSGNQRLQNFYWIVHPYSTCTVSHQDYYSLHVHLIDDYTRYARFFNACFAYLLTVFSFVALSSLLRTLSILCRCLSLYFLTFGMACQ